MKQINNTNMNYYKITTIILGAILLITGLVYGLGYYANSKFVEGAQYGQAVTLDNIFISLNEKGSVTFVEGNASLSLVPAIFLEQAQQEIILEIMDHVQKEGYVTLYNNETELILIPYTNSQEEMYFEE